MKAADLRAIDEASTPRPYRFNEHTGDIEAPKAGHNEFLPKLVCQMYVANHRANAAAIATAMNHLPALIDLAAACERLADRGPVARTVGDRDAFRDLFEAMDRVHAVVGADTVTCSDAACTKNSALRAALVTLLWDSVADDATCTCSPGDVCPQCQATQALGMGRWRGARWAERMLPEGAAGRAVTADQVAEALQAGRRERELAEQRRPIRRPRRSRR